MAPVVERLAPGAYRALKEKKRLGYREGQLLAMAGESPEPYLP
ncbi:hypothetical protein [Thermus antranikianii]|nr:hypothetical protein [Thermus antranikianii]